MTDTALFLVVAKDVLDLMVQIMGHLTKIQPPYLARIRIEREHLVERLRNAHANDDPTTTEEFLHRGLEEARAGDYVRAHSSFLDAQRLVRGSEPNYNVWLYVLWSGIECAFALRGRAGQHLLLQCRSGLAKLLGDAGKDGRLGEQEERAVDEIIDKTGGDFSGTRIAEAYLHFLYGLSYCMCVDDSDRELPEHTCLMIELREYELALTKCKHARNRSKGGLSPQDEKFLATLEKQIEDRNRIVRRMEGNYFGLRW